MDKYFPFVWVEFPLAVLFEILYSVLNVVPNRLRVICRRCERILKIFAQFIVDVKPSGRRAWIESQREVRRLIGNVQLGAASSSNFNRSEDIDLIL